MANQPFYYAKIWVGEGMKINGNILNIQEYLAELRLGAKLWSFNGRVATVCIVTLDMEIHREIALDFAVMFMKGRYVTISVDLKNLTSSITYGTPPP